MMSEPINIRDLIRRGAPTNGDEAREIIRAACEGAAEVPPELEQRLSAALKEIVVCRHLHIETYSARAEALAAIDAISEKRDPSAR
jgi:hypothetical protein